MIKKLRNWFKSAIYDPINDRQVELTAQSNVPVEVVDSNGLNLDLTTDSNVPTEVQKTFFTQNPDGITQEVTTQNPFPTTDGAIVVNDIWIAESDMGDFSGAVTDLFDNLHSVVSNTTSDNPKELVIHLNHTINAPSIIGVGAFVGSSGTFSNIEIQSSLSDGVFTTLVDESADGTTTYSKGYKIPTTIGINAIKLLFHTANTVTLSNIYIPKNKTTISQIQGVDQDELVQNIRATEVGNLMVTDFLIEVSRGNIPGYSSINKFGHNPLVPTTGADIWSGLGTYGFFPTTAQAMEAVSTSVNDDGSPVGTGARTIQVYGLDSAWAEIEETVIMDGVNAVALSNTYIRMYRAEVITAGTVETNDGNISIQISGGGTVGAHIATNDGQTQQAIYTIPGGKSGFFIKGYVALANNNKNGEDGTFQQLARPNIVANGAWAVKGQVSLINIGSSSWQYEYGIAAGPLPEKTDIKLRMTTATAIMDCVGGFDILLIDD